MQTEPCKKKASGSYNASQIKDWLIQYREREREIGIQYDRLEMMKDRLTGVSSPIISDMPKSQTVVPDRLTGLIAAMDDLENDIREAQYRQERTKDNIERLLKKLKNAYERAVIRARYLDCTMYHDDRLSDWNDVLDLLFGGRKDFLEKEDSYLRRVFKLHGDALYHMAVLANENPGIIIELD